VRSLEYEPTLPSSGVQALLVIGCGVALAWLVVHASPLGAGVAFVAVAFLVIFLQRPDLGLMFVLAARAVTDLLAPEATGFAERLMDPNVGLFVILILAGGVFLVAHRVPFLSLPGALPLAFLMITGVVGMLRTPDLLRAIDRWLAVFSALIVYGLATALFRDRQRIQRVIDVMILSFIAPAYAGLYQLVSGHRMYHPLEGVARINGTFVHPGPFGDYLVILFSVLLCQTLVQRAGRKRLAAAFLVVAAYLLGNTLARAPMVGAMIVYLIVGTLRKRALLLLAPLVVAVAVLAVPDIARRFADPLGGSFADRQLIWQGAYREWLSATADRQSSVVTVVNRLLGTGPGSAVVSAGGQYAHDDYLAVFFEYGVLGLIAFLVMTLWLIVTTYRTWRRTTDPPLKAVALAFFAIACAYPVMYFTDNIFSFTQNQLYFWTLAGLTASIAQMDDGIRQGQTVAALDRGPRMPPQAVSQTSP
jgi:O-antigen ligase